MGYKSTQTRKSNNKLHRYGTMCENKKRLVPSSMMCISLCLIITNNTMMCAEDNDISMNTGTNEIVRTNTKEIRREATENHRKKLERRGLIRGTSERKPCGPQKKFEGLWSPTS